MDSAPQVLSPLSALEGRGCVTSWLSVGHMEAVQEISVEQVSEEVRKSMYGQ